MKYNTNGADCANGAIGVDGLNITNGMRGKNGADGENVVEDKHCIDVKSISVHASSATFAKCPKVSVSTEGKIITDSADRNNKTGNANGVDCI